jgi:NAD(P)-dependent dehydrogenase (short-subunit alcohol dehydrogenase family)
MPAEQTVVITGASTGIGRACALHMDKLGWRVFAGVRKDSDAAALRAEASGRLRPLSLDVTDPSSIRAASDALAQAASDGALAGLVNNAGIAYGGPVELIDMADLRRTFEVNFFGAVAVIQAFLPLLRAGGGRIVNVSSISGWVASPFLSPYSTSKFALEALSDALRVELRPWNLRVSVVEPGAIDTPIWSKGAEVLERLRLLNRASQPGLAPYSAALQSTAAELRPHGISAAHVAKAVAHALTSRWPRTRYAVGMDAKVANIFRHLPDGVRDHFFARRFSKW